MTSILSSVEHIILQTMAITLNVIEYYFN